MSDSRTTSGTLDPTAWRDLVPAQRQGLVDTRVLIVDEENKKNIKSVISILKNLVKIGLRV